MARSITQIFDSINSAKQAQGNLSGLTSTSNTAIYRLWMYLTATVLHIHEVLWDQFRQEVEAVVANIAPGTPTWYQSQVVKWQYGHPLTFIDNVPGYAIDDPAARLITSAAVIEQLIGPSRLVLIKVAKDTGGGTLGPLTAPELAAFNGYLDRIKFAGTKTSAISLSPDLLTVNLEVFYDPLLIPADILAKIETAITTYLSQLPFNGQITIISFLDQIIHIEGVRDMTLNSLQANDGTGYVVITGRYTALSGYLIIDPALPLSSSITLTPYV